MQARLNRRQLIKGVCGSLAGTIIAPRLYGWADAPQEHEAGGVRAQMFLVARAFMVKYSVPALSVAVSRNGRFVYEHQFGMADREDAQQTLPSSLFRIASVTKPITSVTIFSLI